MRKRLLFVLLFVSFGLAAMWGQEVSEKEAQVRAQKFVNSHYGRKGGGSELKSLGQVNGLYVFNMNDKGGFVIVSNDERATDILGYSESGQFDPDNMPDNMRAWLQGYADEIAWAQKNIKEVTDVNTKARARTRAEAKATIAPMVTTEWNQRAPYNNLCPEYNPGKKAVTGCVATAMAQVMNYHQWPEGATKAISEYEDGYGVTRPALDPTTFDWANMLPDYVSKDPNTGNTIINGTEAQQNAVATLMKYCGYSVKMNYGPSSSSNSIMVAKALTTYFDYDKETTRVVSRGCYTYANWIDLIYHELKEGRPVVYGGQSYGGGHEFVCDGYDKDTDLFHINWGWGGTSDGYFVLSSLNPDEQGAGGSSSNDGYHFGQDAVVGIQKTEGTGTKPDIPTNKYTLTINDISISHNEIALGESVDITLNVTNSGTEAYDGDLLLVKGGYVFWGEMFIIPANTTGNYVIHYTPTNAGTETISSVFTDNDGNFSAQSKAVTLTTVNQTPTNLTTTDIGSTTASIGWTNVGNAEKWNIRYKSFSITTEDFNGTTSWTIGNWDTDNYKWTKISNAGISGSPCYASPSYIDGTSLNPYDWLISPTFSLGGKISFYAWGENECFSVWVSIDGSHWSSDTPDITTTNVAKLYTFDISKYEGNEGYIAIVHKYSSGHTSESYLYVDDVSQIVPNGDWTTINNVTTNPYTMSQLTPNTGYELQVQPVINNGGKWSKSSFFIKTNGIVLENSTDNSVKDIPDHAAIVNVSLTNRTLYKDGGWNTICLPFSLISEQIATSPLANATIMELDVTGSYTNPTSLASDGTLYLNFKNATEIVAGTPYIIKWTSGDNLVNPVFEGVTIDKTMHDVTSTDGKVTFKGTYESQTFNTENTSILFVGGNNKLYYPAAGASIGAQRAYFQIGSGNSSIRAFNLNFGDDDVTGISNASIMNNHVNWYDLSGRKLNGKPVKKGVYVQNGKKVVIK